MVFISGDILNISDHSSIHWLEGVKKMNIISYIFFIRTEIIPKSILDELSFPSLLFTKKTFYSLISSNSLSIIMASVISKGQSFSIVSITHFANQSVIKMFFFYEES